MRPTDNIERARPFGRILRLLFGVLVFVLVGPNYFIAPMNLLLQTLLVSVGLTVFYIVLEIVIN